MLSIQVYKGCVRVNVCERACTIRTTGFSVSYPKGVEGEGTPAIEASAGLWRPRLRGSLGLGEQG